jgi:hypothetical protein
MPRCSEQVAVKDETTVQKLSDTESRASTPSGQREPARVRSTTGYVARQVLRVAGLDKLLAIEA